MPSNLITKIFLTFFLGLFISLFQSDTKRDLKPLSVDIGLPDVSGTWKGILTQPGGSLPFSIYLTQVGTDIVGTSTISNQVAYATMNLSGTIDGGTVNLVESGIASTSGPPGPNSYWCIKTLQPVYASGTTGEETLEGNWHDFGCNSGQIHLTKVSNWGDIDSIEQNYQNKVGTHDEWYARFWLCLNQNACEEYDLTGEFGVAGGFNKYMFNYFQAHPSWSALNNKCWYMPWVDNPDDMIKLECFFRTGMIHFVTELAPGFYSYGKFVSVENYAQWDEIHSNFVISKNLPCFDETLADAFPSPPFPQGTRDAIIAQLKQKTLSNAIKLRETVQFYYEQQNLLSMEGLKKTNDQIEYPPPLTQKDLYSEDLANILPLHVQANGLFFLDVGTSVQIDITPANNNANTQVGISSNLSYYAVAVDGTVTISEDGVLHILRTSSPFINARPMVYVFVTDGEQFGIGQFAIRDFDLDNDLLADSYEVANGLDPNVPNSIDSDLDGDRLPDYGELIMHTNSLAPDTDGDGYSDFEEFATDSDALNPSCNPNGCYYMLYLPSINQ